MQAGIAEKKISILERALEFHPGSDRLLLALLDAVSALSSSCTLTIPFCLLPTAFCLLPSAFLCLPTSLGWTVIDLLV